MAPASCAEASVTQTATLQATLPAVTPHSTATAHRHVLVIHNTNVTDQISLDARDDPGSLIMTGAPVQPDDCRNSGVAHRLRADKNALAPRGELGFAEVPG